jgi:type II secretory pathway component HofQ
MKTFIAVALVACVGVVACNRSNGPHTNQPSTMAAAKPRVDLELKDAPLYDALRSIAAQAQINLSVDADVTGSVTISVRATPWDLALHRIAREHALQVIPIDLGHGRTVFRIATTTTTSPTSSPTSFAGAPIDVSFHETPIRTVAKALSDFSGVSIVVDEDVQVNVTQWSRQVPWDFVLDHVLRKYELRAIQDGDEIRIKKR